MDLSFHCPTEIRFSREGASGLAAELARSFTEIIVVTGRRSARSSGRLSGLTNALDSASLKVRVVEGVEPNPTAGNIDALRPAFEDDFGQAIVSVGGGS